MTGNLKSGKRFYQLRVMGLSKGQNFSYWKNSLMAFKGKPG
jgi:hypothetical protein